jgi:hypothetical protein
VRRVLVLIALGLAGCGDAASSSKPKPTPETHYALDGEIVTTASLTLDDFPKGWTAEEPESTREGLCTRTEPTEQKGTMGQVREFNHSEVDGFLTRVYVFPDEATAKSAFALLAEVESLTCSMDEFKATRAKEQGIELVDLTTASERPPTAGDAAAVNQMTVVLREDGEEGTLRMSLAVVRESRGVGVLLATYEERLDERLRDRLLRRIASRLAQRGA